MYRRSFNYSSRAPGNDGGFPNKQHQQSDMMFWIRNGKHTQNAKTIKPTDPGSDSSFVAPTAKKGKTQVFREAWLQNPTFKLWLKQTDNPRKAKCTACSKLLTAHKNNLDEHARSFSHMMNLQQNAGASISVLSNAATSSSDKENNSSADVSIAGPSSAASLISNGDSDSSSDSILFVPAAKKRKTQKQAFREAWLEEPIFKPWLKQADDPHKAKCTACSKLITAHKRFLEQHAKSEIHIMNMVYQKEPGTTATKKIFADEVKEAEITICINAIEHDRSFRSHCHFVKMIPKVLTNLDVLPYLSTERTKMAAIAKKVVNKAVIEEGTDILRGKFFSILIDETTDVSNTKILCFLVRYLEKGQMCTYLLDLVELSEAKAENLYSCLLNSLRKNNLPLTNIVAACVDNANVMVGAYNSLTSRLLKDNPEMYVFPCICHSLHLVALHAHKCLPSFVDEFLHSIHNYFSKSPKRKNNLIEIQKFLKEREQMVLQPAPTRWLALSECLKRILNQWPSLFRTFWTADFENESDIAEKIFNFMNCPLTLAYLQFLDYALDVIVKYNKVFQTTDVIVHRLVPQCFNLLKSLACNFVKPEMIRLSNLHELNVENEENIMKEVHLGAACHRTIDEIRARNCEGDFEKITQLYTDAKQYYQCAFKQLVKRLPFNDTYLYSLDFLQPDVALDLSKHRKNHLDKILKTFKSKFNETAVLNEWFNLAAYSTEENKPELLKLSVIEFWEHISTVQDDLDEYEFKNISTLAQLCLLQPHSNADVERYFSYVAIMKTKSRNRLNTDTVAALTRIKLYLNSKKANCSSFQVTNRMLQLFNHKMYNKDDSAEEVLGTLHADESDDE